MWPFLFIIGHITFYWVTGDKKRALREGLWLIMIIITGGIGRVIIKKMGRGRQVIEIKDEKLLIKVAFVISAIFGFMIVLTGEVVVPYIMKLIFK